MIGTHLASGTKIVCVKEGANPLFQGLTIKLGEVYTLEGYAIGLFDDAYVLIAEETGTLLGGRFKYSRDHFDEIVDRKLPDEILACLDVDPARVPDLETV